MLAPPDLRENVVADAELRDGGLARGDLTDAELQAESDLSQRQQPGGPLAQAEQQPCARLSHGDDPRGGMTDGHHAQREPSHGEHALGHHSAAGFGVSAAGVVDQRQTADARVAAELREVLAARVDEAPPDAAPCVAHLKLDLFEQ